MEFIIDWSPPFGISLVFGSLGYEQVVQLSHIRNGVGIVDLIVYEPGDRSVIR